MSLEYIRNYYKVPAFEKQRVEYYDQVLCLRKKGTIRGYKGAYIVIHFDGDEVTDLHNHHPVWGITYLDENDKPIDTKVS